MLQRCKVVPYLHCTLAFVQSIDFFRFLHTKEDQQTVAVVYFRNTMFLAVDTLQIVINFLGIIIPAGIIFFIVYWLINKFLEDQYKTRLLELKRDNQKHITPVKLQALERLTLFLDRISPDNIVLRHSRSGQTAAELRKAILQNISDEFNHNISQQIYISNDAWNMIKAVKEQIIGIVECCYKNCDENDSGPDLGKKILNYLIESKQMTTQQAINLLKQELAQIV